MDIELRGVYQVLDSNGIIVYIGSSHLPIEGLEYNHRNWQDLDYSGTKFRRALVRQGADWTFQWVPGCPVNATIQAIEKVEGALIREFRPKYNKDLTPYETSIYRGRY